MKLLFLLFLSPALVHSALAADHDTATATATSSGADHHRFLLRHRDHSTFFHGGPPADCADVNKEKCSSSSFDPTTKDDCKSAGCAWMAGLNGQAGLCCQKGSGSDGLDVNNFPDPAGTNCNCDDNVCSGEQKVCSNVPLCAEGDLFCFCEEGTCVDCRDDSQCERDQRCSENACVSNTCTAESDCPEERTCYGGSLIQAGTCALKCGTSSECPEGQKCENYQVCVIDEGYCTNDSECLGGDYTCINNKCEHAGSGGLCNLTGCPEGETCIDGACVSGGGGANCSSDSECPGNLICSNTGSCVCNGCAPGKLCTENGDCVNVDCVLTYASS